VKVATALCLTSGGAFVVAQVGARHIQSPEDLHDLKGGIGGQTPGVKLDLFFVRGRVDAVGAVRDDKRVDPDTAVSLIVVDPARATPSRVEFRRRHLFRAGDGALDDPLLPRFERGLGGFGGHFEGLLRKAGLFGDGCEDRKGINVVICCRLSGCANCKGQTL